MLRHHRYSIARGMRWAARIIGLSAAGFMMMMLIGAAFTEGIGENTSEAIQGISLGILELLALVGSIISWWRQRLAAIVLILASAGLAAHIGIIAQRNHLLAWAMVGLPYFLAGVLLLYSQRLARQQQ